MIEPTLPKLRPCPLCPTSTKFPPKLWQERRYASRVQGLWAVECTNCGLEVYGTDDAESAAKAWNTRQTDETIHNLIAALEHALYNMSRDQQGTMTEPAYEEATAFIAKLKKEHL